MLTTSISLDQRLAWLKKTIGNKNVVLGISGGLDSAVCLALLVKSLPVEHILPLIMPVIGQEIAPSLRLCQDLGVSTRTQVIDITPIVEAATDAFVVDDELRRGNLAARTRMMCLYDAAKKNQALVCGTSNRSEYLLGYFTLWGDSAQDLAPLLDLTKTEVRALARELGLDEQLISQPPTAGLWAGQTDEQELGFSYELADQVIAKMDRGSTDFTPEEAPVLARIQAEQYKHELPYHL